jgi:AcrR family transcriptional regulator
MKAGNTSPAPENWAILSLRVITPWGDTEKLRSLSPPRGRHATDRAASIAGQRQRLFGAMVAASAEKGYAATTVGDLVRLSGVGHGSFYNLFGSKRECFLAAIDEIQEIGMARVRHGYRSEEDWERRIRAAFAELLEMVVAQPAAAHMHVVDVYEAGPEGSKRVREGLAGFEELLGRSFEKSPSRAGVPAEIVAAIVAGIQMVIHDRLRRGAVSELPRLATELGDWALSYETPPQLLGEGGVPTAIAASERGEGQRARIVGAVAEICATAGVTRLTAEGIAARARISLSTLYKLFPGGAEEAFLATFEEIVALCLQCSREAYGTELEWPARMHAVNRELFAYLASEPAFAKTALVEVLGAGPMALARRDRSLAPFGELLEGGQQLAPQVPDVVREAIVFAVYSLVGREIEAGGAKRLSRLVPTATYIELAPYLGAKRAATVANGSGKGAVGASLD